jgi:hypothetical protein
MFWDLPTHSLSPIDKCNYYRKGLCPKDSHFPLEPIKLRATDRSDVTISRPLHLDLVKIAVFVDRLTIRIGFTLVNSYRLVADGTSDSWGLSFE